MANEFERIDQRCGVGRLGFGQFTFDPRVERRQLVKRHHRIHVVFDMVVNVPAQKPHDRVGVNRAGIAAVVKHIFFKTRMFCKKHCPYQRPTCDAGGKGKQQRSAGSPHVLRG